MFYFFIKAKGVKVLKRSVVGLSNIRFSKIARIIRIKRTFKIFHWFIHPFHPKSQKAQHVRFFADSLKIKKYTLHLSLKKSNLTA
jgi:hypothetical protein